MIAMLLVALLSAGAVQSQGVTRFRSTVGVAETVARVDRAARARGLTVFATIDHAANARAADLELRPTVVIIVGNPRAGTRLMHCGQEVAVDLPLRILVWQDDAGSAWVGYTPMAELARRHALRGCDDLLQQMEAALSGLARAAADSDG